MVRQKHNLVGNLALSRIFPAGQNVQCVFCLVGQFLIFIGHFPVSDSYFKACHLLHILCGGNILMNVLWIKIYSTYLQELEVFCKKGVLENFAKFTGKHQCQSLFFIKLQVLQNTTRRLLLYLWPRSLKINRT